MAERQADPDHNTLDRDTPDNNAQPSRTSRRKVLAGLGIGAAAVSVPSAAAAAGRRGGGRGPNGDGNRGGGDGRPGRPTRPDRPTVEQPNPPTPVDDGPQRFIRMFEDHPPFDNADDELREQLVELGRPGGMLDANDPLEVGPARLITEPELSPNNRDNPNCTAGTTFFGQFLDHDITHDAGSQLGRPTSLRRSSNLRTARLDLDSVYGGGPDESPDMYQPNDRVALRVESGGLFEDVPRTGDGTAIIGDPRNDENLIISGMQAGFLLLHNAVLERERSSTNNDELAFERAQQTVRWHYQWTVVHEFLPQIVGQELVDDILENGRRHYRPERPRIPVEFQTSAYRFGHSMIRPSYRANLAGDDGEAFFAPVFDLATIGQADPTDLSGGHRAPRRFIGWQTFFDFGGGEVKPNKRIDTTMSSPLFALPMGVVSNNRGEPIGPTSLATRNLLRHITWGIPSGQDVAQSMGEPVLSAGDLADINSAAPRLVGATPLWLYILREADVFEDGLRLGPVGGRIVAEVFIGLLQMDSSSYLAADSDWQPTLPARSGDAREFGMADLLTVAGVDPVSRGQ